MLKMMFVNYYGFSIELIYYGEMRDGFNSDYLPPRRLPLTFHLSKITSSEKWTIFISDKITNSRNWTWATFVSNVATSCPE